MKITKKLLMKIIKEELVRESMSDWQAHDRRERGLPPLKANYDISNSIPPDGYVPPPEPKLENPPPLPPATEQDLEKGRMVSFDGPYEQQIHFLKMHNQWLRRVYMKPRVKGYESLSRLEQLKVLANGPNPGAVHADKGSLEDYPLA